MEEKIETNGTGEDRRGEGKRKSNEEETQKTDAWKKEREVDERKENGREEIEGNRPYWRLREGKQRGGGRGKRKKGINGGRNEKD